MVKVNPTEDFDKWSKYNNEAWDLYRKLQANGSLEPADKKRLGTLTKEGYYTHSDVRNYLETGTFFDSEKAKTQKERRTTLYVWLGIGAAILVGAYWYYGGETKPGAFHEKREYSAKVYVNVFPDSEKAKNYHLPADIRRVEGGYYVEKVYWPNGGYLDFSGGECLTELNEKTDKYSGYCTHVNSDSEQDYTIEITSELVE